MATSIPDWVNRRGAAEWMARVERHGWDIMSPDEAALFAEIVRLRETHADGLGCPKCLVGVPGILSDPMFNCDVCDGTGEPTIAGMRRLLAEAWEHIRATWQPIATAPKDGTWILAYEQSHGPGIWPARFDAEQGRWLHPDGFDMAPTHWMKRPAPPTP